jgi:hypothetical protein
MLAKLLYKNTAKPNIYLGEARIRFREVSFSRFLPKESGENINCILHIKKKPTLCFLNIQE